jgi:hypothetical protein
MTSTQKAWLWIGGIIVVLAIIIFSSSGQNSNATTQVVPTTQIPPISLSQVQITPLKIDCAYGGGFPNCSNEFFSISGEVTNNSSKPFDTINLIVEAYDCPSTTITSNCTHIGEDKSAFLEVSGGDGLADFPSGQTKEATGQAFLVGLPPIQGNFVWNYTITGFPSSLGLIPVTQ